MSELLGTQAKAPGLSERWGPVALYLLKRLLSGALVLLAGTAAVFFTIQAAPGDPALSALGEQATPEAIAAFRAEYGLDAPLMVQYVRWLLGFFQGDLGQSLAVARGMPVGALVLQKLPATVFVGFFALFLAVVLSLVLGTLAALNRGKATDTIATSIAVFGVSMPDFWMSYVLIFGLSLGLGLFPAFGYVAPSTSLTGALHATFLPALAIAAPMAAVFARTLRAVLIETLSKPYVTAAKSFGLRRPFILVHFVLRNAMVPYLTVVGLQIRYILGGVVVVERIFGIPGIGSLMVDGAFARDYNVLQACTVVFLAIVLLVNVAVDMICALLDPKQTVK
ncbi:ABC transporter permease [Pseudodonghicola flavimaris]|uniref:ABC transporter permease n=1 Tax=Pseudodonghicola flavimaris TaxID=3050036 RepID=A0ABT7F1S9_9RHOB|nr:ABC transporter permease [Pseudodonghicola flavimaris]MDK3018559.1 ABC transporter permease [Pseudodonghicola flavimaris]